MIRSQHVGTCERCGRAYGLGARLLWRMVAMGTPRQRYAFRHAGGCS